MPDSIAVSAVDEEVVDGGSDDASAAAVEGIAMIDTSCENMADCENSHHEWTVGAGHRN